VERELGLSVEPVHRTPKPTPEKTARIWAEERPKALASRLRGFAKALGRGAYLRKVGPEPKGEQGPREAVLNQRVFRICGDDQAHGVRAGQRLGLAHSVSRILGK